MRTFPGAVDYNAIIAWSSIVGVRGATASITIRNLDDGAKRRLRVRAAQRGRSMEAEAREILRQALGSVAAPANLGQAIHARFAALGGVELALPVRGPMRKPPSMS